MKKKSAILSVVLIAVMCGFILPTQVKAFQTPSPPYGPSNQSFNYFGPAANELIMKFYSSDTAEFSALQTSSIDFMDSILTPTQYSAISGNPAITTGFVAATELIEYDLNNYAAPFSNIYYRQAFAALVNRTAYLDTYFAGGGTPCYDPLDFNPFGQAAEAYCEAIYGPQGNFADAYSEFVLSGYPTYLENGSFGLPNLGTTNPNGGGYFTWFFASPYPTTSSGSPAGTNTSSPYDLAIPNATIQIFARTEHAERLDQAAYIIGLDGYSRSVGGPFSGDTFTMWCENQYALYGNSYFASLGMALPIVGGKPYFPVINFMETDITSEVADNMVMTYYRYQMYTGAWILDEFQDGLEIWLSAEVPGPPSTNGWGPFCLNYDYW
ncbi:MAG TPA: ABC transporter substrate-binding protein, partial [Candidatus Bathyarchaeia archaeon]|nr:ABC transporter substrate-binding protein [Candidatus Bathyarchaeia archaeon]